MQPYLSSATFLRCASAAATAAAAASPPLFTVIGLPWDSAVTNRPGARFGPQHIRTASHMLCDATHPLFNVSPVDCTVDLGDLALPNTNLQAMRSELEKFVAATASSSRIAPGSLPVFLGGDHSVTLSTLAGLQNRNKKNKKKKFACIHFDAHCDTWADHFGEPSGHGTWVREAINMGIVDPKCMFQIGIRSSADDDARNFVTRHGGMIFTGRDMRGVDSVDAINEKVVSKIVDRLVQEQQKQKQQAGENGDDGDELLPDLYLTFDIDCVDPSAAPGTGTPEPGGLTSNQALTLVEELARHPLLKSRWCGMDLVEVAPAYDDRCQNTSLVASHLVWSWMCGVMAAKQQQ